MRPWRCQPGRWRPRLDHDQRLRKLLVDVSQSMMIQTWHTSRYLLIQSLRVWWMTSDNQHIDRCDLVWLMVIFIHQQHKHRPASTNLGFIWHFEKWLFRPSVRCMHTWMARPTVRPRTPTGLAKFCPLSNWHQWSLGYRPGSLALQNKLIIGR